MIFSLRSLLQSLTFLLLCSLVATLPVQAETKVLTAEGTYTMGDGESPSFAEAMVLQKAKQTALEQAGTYVESYTKVKNYDLTNEEIQTIAGGVLEVLVLEKTRTLVGDGLRFSIKIKATVTTDKMEELAQRIKGKNVAEEYKKLREDYARLSTEIEKWKELIAKTPPGPDREAVLDQIREREKAFASLQEGEAAFFHRLASGEILVKKAKTERATVDALFEKILKSGHVITIGEPTSHQSKDDPEKMELRIPISLRTTNTIRTVVEETARSLGGETRGGAYERSIGGARRKVNAAIVRMGADAEVAGYFQKRVGSLNFVLKLLLQDGAVFVCQDWDMNTNPAHEYYLETNPITPVFGIHARYVEFHSRKGVDMEEWFEEYERTYVTVGKAIAKAPVRWIGKDDVLLAGSLAPGEGVNILLAASLASFGETFKRSPLAEVVVFEDTRRFTVTAILPVGLAKHIKAITGQFVEGGRQQMPATADTPFGSQGNIQREPSGWERLFQAEEVTKATKPSPPLENTANRLACSLEP